MTSWILDGAGSLNPEQHAVAEGLAQIVARLNPPHLDVASSGVTADDRSLTVTLAHRIRPELTIDVHAGGRDEIVVSYGHEHEHFRSDDAENGRVWPFSSGGHIETGLTLVEGLLKGRVELHVWRRPLAYRTRSYWIDDQGQVEVFLRGWTMGPFLGWSRTPEIYRFDFT